MPPFQQYSRVNLLDLKAQMVKRVGPERAGQYFKHFKGYINSRLNKTELDKLVVLTIGKENIGLHNEIVKAVLSNAIKSETAPPLSLLAQDASKPVKGVRRKVSLPYATGVDASVASKSPTSVWENGNFCADSPRKERLRAFDQRNSTDQRNILGRRTDGMSCLVDLHRPFRHNDDAAEQSAVDHKDGQTVLLRSKRPRIIVPSSSPDVIPQEEDRTVQFCSSKTDHSELGEAPRHQQWDSEIVRGTYLYTNSIGSVTKLPFIPFTGSSQQAPPVEGIDEEYLYAKDLPSTQLLQRHMEYIAALEGVEGVSKECVEVVNQGIDSFLKRLIGACIDFVKTRPGMQQGVRATGRQLESNSHPSSLQSSGLVPSYSGGARKENEESAAISILDFKLAMDLNPQQLGHNWPLQLEKIHLYSSDELSL